MSRAKILTPFLFLAYKIPYNFAICTQDGSGVEFYLNRLLNTRTKRKILINGVKKYKATASKKRYKKFVFLFVGKLIEEKGVPELIEAMCELKKIHSNFVLNIVGKGHLEGEINKLILEKKLKDQIKLIGSVRQNEINKYYEAADIYISLNKLGNLSNTVLEAMSMNKCIVMLQKDVETHTDVYTEKVIPMDTVIRIDRKMIVRDLTEKLDTMISDPQLINTYSIRMENFADKFLWTWDQRVDFEIDLLKQV
jgi:glycosyltransferase involved in cell wall biosynthesis